MTRGRLWRIVSSYFVAGLVVDDGVVVEAAPIIRGTVGKRWPDVRAQFVSKGFSGSPVDAA